MYVKFESRLTVPEKDNKYYIVQSYGGYSPCIQGNSSNRYFEGSVLSNCVGAEAGRFNEESKEDGCKWLGNTNAENFVTLAKRQGLKTGTKPVPGAAIVWACGVIGKGSDGAGHVGNVEETYNMGGAAANWTIKTFESGWYYRKGEYVTTPTRKRGSGNWGQGSGYNFLAFIYNPNVISFNRGVWDEFTTHWAQIAYGTKDDWEVSAQPNGCREYLPAVSTDSWKFRRIFTTGSDLIRTIQKDLKARGYYAGRLDGSCGPQTIKALQKFLKDKGYYVGPDTGIDGYLGYNTAAAFQDYICDKILGKVA